MQKEWFEELEGEHDRRLVIEEGTGSELVAFVRMTDIDWWNGCACVGLDTMLSARGLGYAKPCFRVLLDHCFLDLRLETAYLFVAEYNDIARNLYSDLGFTDVGLLPRSLFKDGKYYGQHIMYLLKTTYMEAQ
jgi:RimJ/RimL family protein N-acetyltransferase